MLTVLLLPLLLTLTDFAVVPLCVTPMVLVLPVTVILADVVPVLVLVWVTELLSPVMLMLLVWLAPVPRLCMVVLLSPTITLLMVLLEHVELTELPQVIDCELLSPVAVAVTVVLKPFTVRSKLLLVPTCSMVTVFDPLPM